jgi:redox-sensitive bicupin YhaK (pirin superfamily)
MKRRELIVGAGALLVGCHGKSTRAEPIASIPSPRVSVLRRIESVPSIDGAGATLQRVFPQPSFRNLDPFVLLDDFDVQPPAGFPEHPHRGFEAFTYMIAGTFEHADNLGNVSRVTAGGTQRFNSGRGARHSEMPGTSSSNRGLQLWVNLPRKLKQMDPEYADTQPDAMPVDESSGLVTRTIVGERSPVALHTEVEYLDVKLIADATFARTIPDERNTLVYVIDGVARIGDEEVPRGHGVLLSAGELEVVGNEGTRFAFLSGRPHGEPILHRGPFVD